MLNWLLKRSFLLFVLISHLVLCLSDTSSRLSAISHENENFVIPVTDGDLSLVSGDRDFYTLLVLTSNDPQHGCELCHEIESMVTRVSNAWFSDYGSTNFLFFINVDLKFKANFKLANHLNINTVPHIWLVPPGKQRDIDQDKEVTILDESRFIFKVPIASKDEQALEFARFMSEVLQKSIILREENPVYHFLRAFLPTLLLVVIIKKKNSQFFNNSSKKNIYMAISILLILTFTCGYQFSTMEKVPFVAKNDRGGISVISGGIHYQFGIETIIIALNYLSLAISFISLVYLGKYKVTSSSFINSEEKKFILINSNAIVLYLLYSCLTSIFETKEPDYPYGLNKLF